jgi:FeS assembly protein IscX
MSSKLYWDTSYEIVLALMEQHPQVDFETLGTEQLRQWIVALPDFADDPNIVTEEILNSIFQEWFEENMFNE